MKAYKKKIEDLNEIKKELKVNKISNKIIASEPRCSFIAYELEHKNHKEATKELEMFEQQIKKEAREEVKVLLNKHRGKGFITCDKTCFCWDVEALLNKKQLKKERR